MTNLGFLVLATTAMPMKGAAILAAGFRKLSKADCVSLFFSCIIVYIQCLLSEFFFGLIVNCFWHLNSLLGPLSSNFQVSALLFKSHQAEFDIGLQVPSLHSPFFQILSFSPLISKNFWFSSTTNITFCFFNFKKFLCFWIFFLYSFMLIVLDIWRPSTQLVCLESTHLLRKRLLKRSTCFKILADFHFRFEKNYFH